MDLLRAERLTWAAVFAAVVALVVAYALFPAGTGVPRPVVAAVVFALVGAVAVRIARSAASPRTEFGDQTIQYVVFFVVAAGGQVGLAAVGYEGVGPRLAAFAAGWLAATRAKRLNPRRRGERPA
jgi:membrane associated rhomboid family serine protease